MNPPISAQCAVTGEGGQAPLLLLSRISQPRHQGGWIWDRELLRRWTQGPWCGELHSDTLLSPFPSVFFSLLIRASWGEVGLSNVAHVCFAPSPSPLTSYIARYSD